MIIGHTNKTLKEMMCLMLHEKKETSLVATNFLEHVAKKFCGYPGHN